MIIYKYTLCTSKIKQKSKKKKTKNKENTKI